MTRMETFSRDLCGLQYTVSDSQWSLAAEQDSLHFSLTHTAFQFRPDLMSFLHHGPLLGFEHLVEDTHGGNRPEKRRLLPLHPHCGKSAPRLSCLRDHGSGEDPEELS